MRTRRSPLLLAALAVLAASAARVTTAQSIYGSLVGTVKDTTGAVVPKVNVTVTRVETGAVRTYTTDSHGNYTATNLPPGEYAVEADLAGFKKARRSGITVAVNTSAKVDLTLEVGQATEVVDAVAEAPVLNTTTGSLGHVVDNRTILNLPLPSGGGGRNFFTLALTMPGVTAQYEGYGLNNMRINGGRPKADDYLLDGTSVQQIVFGGPAITPPADSIQEFKVDSNSFPAEYGRISGGIMNAVTKSGSNRFHASAWEFMRSDAFDARDFFLPVDEEKNELTQHEFGATLGGPIVKNKLFFFVDYQGFRRDSEAVFTNVQVPTAAMKQGNFSAAGVTIKDPLTGQPFPGNRIPAGRFSRVASSLLPLWPDPGSGTNFSRVAQTRNRLHQFDARIDLNASSSDRFFGVLHYADYGTRAANPLPDERAAGELRLTDQPKTGTLGWDHSFGSNTINTFRFGFMHREPARVPGGYGTVSPADYGLATVPACNLPDSGGKCGTPIIGFAGGWEGLSGGTMLFEPAKIFQVANSVTRVMGSHNVKAGVDIRYFRIDNIQPNDVNGSFSFNGSATGHPFADFLLGYVNTGNVQFQEDFFKTHTWSYAGFIQDDWKVTPNLTLNLGLRYQLDKTWRARVEGQAGIFNRTTLEYEILGLTTDRETNFDEDYDNFGPRLGFSWNPTENLVVRGAYGMMFPGNTTRGRGGDLDPSATLLVNTRVDGKSLDNLGPIASRIDNPVEFIKGVGAYTQSTKPDQEQQMMQQWNLTLERQFFGNTLFAVSYAGSKGSHLLHNFFYNIFQRTEAQVRATGWAGYAEDSPNGPPGNGAVGWIFPLFEQDGSSIYHSLQAKVDKRFEGGLSFVASYTFSKLIDDASADWSTFGGLDVQGQDYFTRQTSDRSVSAGDVKHRFVLSAIAELPFGEGKRWLNSGGVTNALFGGWQLSGIFTAHSGFPFGVVDNCFGFCNAARAWATRPDIVGTVVPSNQTIERWLDATAYKNNWNDTGRPFGNAPRYDDHARGPSYYNLDLALIKSTKVGWLGEDGRIELRAEMFNAFNTPHFAMPVASFPSDAFGTITGTASPNRQVQFGLKLLF